MATEQFIKQCALTKELFDLKHELFGNDSFVVPCADACCSAKWRRYNQLVGYAMPRLRSSGYTEPAPSRKYLSMIRQKFAQAGQH